MSNSEELTIGLYKVRNKIGEGSFGQIYQVEKDSLLYAVKTESITNVKPMVSIEYDIFKQLSASYNLEHKGYGFPKVYEYHQEEHFSYFLMDKYDLTLQDLANQELQNQIHTDVILIIMFNTLKCLRAIHNLGYLYRDVKPSNFMLNRRQLEEGNARIYLIDLGLCKKYMKKDSSEHIPLKSNKKMIGTPIFCSLNIHLGLESSRRDDLESWVYMIIYFLKRLPWEQSAVQSLPGQMQKETHAAKEQKYLKIQNIKESTSIIDLIRQSQNLPRCLIKIYEHIRGLQFQEKPNYELIQQVIQEQYLKITGRKEEMSQLHFRVGSLKKAVEPSAKKNIRINFKIDSKNKQLKKLSLQQININNILEK